MFSRRADGDYFLLLFAVHLLKEEIAMPVTTTPSDRLTPKSVLHHRPIAPDHNHSTQEPPSVPRASRATRTQTQTQRSTPRQPPSSASMDVPTWKQASTTDTASSAFSARLLPSMGVSIILAVVLVVLTQLLIGWVGNTWNDLHYGSPRTFQVDAVVGHDDSTIHPSHFIALNLHGQVDILEFPGGDVSHARVYVGPQISGPEAAFVPVTLRFVTLLHTSLPNMVVIVGSSQFVFVNAHGTFVSPGATQP